MVHLGAPYRLLELDLQIATASLEELDLFVGKLSGKLCQEFSPAPLLQGRTKHSPQGPASGQMTSDLSNDHKILQAQRLPQFPNATTSHLHFQPHWPLHIYGKPSTPPPAPSCWRCCFVASWLLAAASSSTYEGVFEAVPMLLGRVAAGTKPQWPVLSGSKLQPNSIGMVVFIAARQPIEEVQQSNQTGMEESSSGVAGDLKLRQVELEPVPRADLGLHIETQRITEVRACCLVLSSSAAASNRNLSQRRSNEPQQSRIISCDASRSFVTLRGSCKPESALGLQPAIRVERWNSKEWQAKSV